MLSALYSAAAGTKTPYTAGPSGLSVTTSAIASAASNIGMKAAAPGILSGGDAPLNSSRARSWGNSPRSAVMTAAGEPGSNSGSASNSSTCGSSSTETLIEPASTKMMTNSNAADATAYLLKNHALSPRIFFM